MRTIQLHIPDEVDWKEMSALPKGLYFVKFSGERINKVVKVVKE